MHSYEVALCIHMRLRCVTYYSETGQSVKLYYSVCAYAVWPRVAGVDRKRAVRGAWLGHSGCSGLYFCAEQARATGLAEVVGNGRYYERRASRAGLIYSPC